MTRAIDRDNQRFKEIVRGKVAVFIATPQAAGLTGGRGAQPVLRCDSVPNKFGAYAAAQVEAAQRADSLARAGRGGGGGGGRGGRAGGGGGGGGGGTGPGARALATVGGSPGRRRR